jgi:transposase-like protein
LIRNFVHNVQDVRSNIEEVDLCDVCEAAEIYVGAGETGLDDEDIEDLEGVDGHLSVTHSDTSVIGDAHTTTCENRHSFLRQWLAKFRGVSKHHLQKYRDSSH